MLSLTLQQVIDALALRFGAASIGRIFQEPDSRIEDLFGRQLVLSVPDAGKLGFRDDATVDALVARAFLTAA